MIGKIFGLIAGPAGPWVLLGIFLAGLAAGGAGGWAARGLIDAPALAKEQTATALADGRTQVCIATHEKARADGSEKTTAALVKGASDVTDALNALAAKAALRGKGLDQFMKEIANAPASHVCGGSAAELAFRRSVRGEAASPAAP